jgi:hypothetical protein
VANPHPVFVNFVDAAKKYAHPRLEHEIAAKNSKKASTTE